MAESKKPARIPLVDLAAQYATLKSEILPLIEKVIEDGAFIKGKYVQDFENRFAEMHGMAGRGVACANGTAAIGVALRALGIGAGDEVITTPNTFFATAEGILEVGAKPVFVDVLPATGLIDPAKIEAAVTPETKAILPVHLYGTPCEMGAIGEIAARRKLLVVEDCAQAHFAKFDGRYVGTFGDASTFSFYPGKNLGAYGDAGFVLFRDPAKAAVGRKLVDHGRESKYVHDLVAANERMDGIQGAVLGVKLKYVLEWSARRRAVAALYRARLEPLGIEMPTIGSGCEPVYHLFPIFIDRRDAVLEKMREEGIEAGIHYPVPLHLQPALKFLGHREGDFPHSERIAKRELSLPIFPEMAEGQLDRVVDALENALGK